MAKLVCIKTYNNRAEADLAKALLESNDIKAMISEVFSAVPALESAMGLRLLVKEEDVERAILLLGNEAED